MGKKMESSGLGVNSIVLCLVARSHSHVRIAFVVKDLTLICQLCRFPMQ